MEGSACFPIFCLWFWFYGIRFYLPAQPRLFFDIRTETLKGLLSLLPQRSHSQRHLPDSLAFLCSHPDF